MNQKINVVTGWSQKGEDLAIEFFHKNMKGANYDEVECLREAYQKLRDRAPGVHEPSYELAGHYTRDGRPVLLTMADDCFEWGEIDA